MGNVAITDATQIALTLAGIALVALLVSKSSATVSLVNSIAQGYGGLLNIVTLQSTAQQNTNTMYGTQLYSV